MTDALLRALGEAVGLASHWSDYRDQPREISPETLRAVLAAMALPCHDPAAIRESLGLLEAERARPRLPPLLIAPAGGMAALPAAPGLRAGQPVELLAEDGARSDGRLELRGGALSLPAPATPGYYALAAGACEATLAVAPPRACTLADLAPGRRAWGVCAQLYALRRAGDGGLGDFTALAELASALGARGADAIGISPVHAPFLSDTTHFSPYSPSSRLFLNPWHVDPAELAGAGAVREIAARHGLTLELERLERLPLVEWAAVARTRLALLRGLFELAHEDSLPAAGLREFRRQGGAALEDHARFDALQARLLEEGQPWHWREWPAALRDPRSAAVAARAREDAHAVDFHVFLQWLASRGLAGAQHAARAAGMQIGLIADLAVGTDGGGSHAWSRQHDLLAGLSVGAPPDDLNAGGQSWGLTTFSPRALRLHGYAPFIEMLRATLRHAGGLRIDHVLGLNRLWVVPEGAAPTQGAYLRYPLADLLSLIALESWRHRALIVGEDLGTVPEGFRPELAAAGLMGLRVLLYQREHGLFVDPARWPAEALATTTTHDTPTLAGWWEGRDLAWRHQLGLAGATPAERAGDRRALWAAFTHAGVAAGPVPADSATAVDAGVQFVARTPAPLVLVPLEDLAGLPEQPNLPGTVEQHPNWRRRLPAPCAELFAAPAVAGRLDGLQRERPSG